MARRSSSLTNQMDDMPTEDSFVPFAAPGEIAPTTSDVPQVEPGKEGGNEDDVNSKTYTVNVKKIAWSRPQGAHTRYIIRGYVTELKKDISLFCNSEAPIEVNDTLTAIGEIVSERNPRGHLEEKLEAAIVQHKVDASPASIQTWLEKHIRDVGPATAQRIVEMLGGGRALNRFTDAEGMVSLGVKRSHAEEIAKKYQDNAAAAKNYMFLVSLVNNDGKQILNKAQIKNIQAKIPSGVLEETIKQNPWSVMAIEGIDFKTADNLGLSMGFKWECPQRVHAGCLHALRLVGQDPRKGYTAVPEDIMIETATTEDVLGVDANVIKNMLSEMIENETIIKDESTGYLYTPEMWNAEATIVERVVRILSKPPYVSPETARELMLKCSKLEGVNLDESQQAAVMSGIMYPVLVITGGPGTGKSTVQKVLFRALASTESNRTATMGDAVDEEDYSTISPSCPTGKGAVRLAEASGFSASTIHRQLEWSAQEGGFRRNKHSPINASVVATDEYSMTDTLLCASQLSAVHDKASLLLIGDDNQLTSVGPGQVLRDLIDSGLVPVAQLTRTHRQAKGSGIPIAAQRILDGFYPFEENEKLRGCTHINVDDSLGMAETLKIVADDMVAQGLSPDTDIIVMSPMRKGTIGVTALNDNIKTLVNPKTDDEETYEFSKQSMTLHDLVMNIENNIDIGVMNGDSGNVIGFTKVAEYNSKGEETGKMLDTPIIDFNGKIVTFPPDKISNLTSNNASTVHKQQGSESTVAIVILPKTAAHMTSKNLLFTGLTRAKGNAYIVGSAETLMRCINNVSATNRITGLKKKLRDQIPHIKTTLERQGASSQFLEDNLRLIEERERKVEEINARAEAGHKAPSWAVKQTRYQLRNAPARPAPPPVARHGQTSGSGTTPSARGVRLPPGLRRPMPTATPGNSAPATPTPANPPVAPRTQTPTSPPIGVRRPMPAMRPPGGLQRPATASPQAPAPAARPAPVEAARPVTRPAPVARPIPTSIRPVRMPVRPPVRPQAMATPPTQNSTSSPPPAPAKEQPEASVAPVRNPAPVRRPPTIRRVTPPTPPKKNPVYEP